MRPLRPDALPRALFELAFGAITLATAAPLAASRHVPLQDLPQHMAAIAVLRQLPFSASLGEYFTATLSRTQYLIVYLLGIPLSTVFGVEGAGKLLAALTVIASRTRCASCSVAPAATSASRPSRGPSRGTRR